MKLQKIAIILAGLLLSGCAVQKAPSGGPKDTQPPRVVYHYPSTDSLNLRKLDRVVFKFSEPVKRSSLKKALRINPPLKTEEKYKWHGEKTVEIFLADTLKEHSTYSIMLGTELEDWHGNNMAVPLVIAFSTDSVLYTCKIKGRFLDYDGKNIITVNVYDKSIALEADTAWYDTEPALITTCTKDGSFEISYLKPGEYRLLAFSDLDYNRNYTPYIDPYALFPHDISLVNNGDSTVHLFARLTTKDTAKVKFSKIEKEKAGELKLVFSKPTLPKAVSIVTLRDSSHVPYYFYAGSKVKEIFPVYLQQWDKEDSLQIAVDLEGRTLIRDYYYRPGKDTVAKVAHRIKDIAQIYFSDSLILKFTNPIDSLSLLKNMELKLKERSCEYYVDWNDFKDIKIIPANGWKLGGKYLLRIREDSVKDYWGQAIGDTVKEYSIGVISEEDLGGIAGRFIGIPAAPKVIFDLFNIKNKNKYRRDVELKDNKKYELTYLPEGLYTISGWFETIPDGKWNGGSVLPFIHSEPLFTLDDTVKVRIRWIKDGINIY